MLVKLNEFSMSLFNGLVSKQQNTVKSVAVFSILLNTHELRPSKITRINGSMLLIFIGF